MAQFFIIIPTYNSAQYLGRCLASIFLLQSGGHAVHVHIQDNESTDATLDIAEAWRDSGVTCKSEKDEGLYDAVAKGATHLRLGQIMTWLGSDDVLMPGALATIASVLEAFSDIAWISSPPFVGSDTDGSYTPSLTVHFSRKNLSAGLHDGRSRPFLMQEGTFWRSELWLKTGGIDRKYRYAGDWDLWRRFAQFTPVYMLSFPTARFSMREGQASSDMKAYYREVDASVLLSTVDDDTTYRLIRHPGEAWKIEAESRAGMEADLAAGCFALTGFDKLEGPYPEMRIPKIRWAFGPSAQIRIKKGCRPILARMRLGTWLENQTVEVLVGGSIVSRHSIPLISENEFCFTEIVTDLTNLCDGDCIELLFSTWQKDADRPIAVMLSGLEET